MPLAADKFTNAPRTARAGRVSSCEHEAKDKRAYCVTPTRVSKNGLFGVNLSKPTNGTA